MKIFTFSFKSLLLAAGLIVGSANAWADTKVTFYSNDFSASNSLDLIGVSASANQTLELANDGDSYGNYIKQTTADRTRDVYMTVTSLLSSNFKDYTDYTVEFDAAFRSGATNRTGGNSLTLKTTGSDIFKMATPSTQVNAGDLVFTVTGAAEGKEITLTSLAWYHFKFEITSSSVTYTVTLASNGSAVTNGTGTLDITDSRISEVRFGTARSSGQSRFDNLDIYTMTSEKVANQPTFAFYSVSGDNRVYTITNPNGEGTLYYTTVTANEAPSIGDAAYSSTTDANINVSFGTGTYYAYVVLDDGTTTSSIASQAVTGGAITLNAPVFKVEDLVLAEDGFYYPKVSFSSDNTGVLGSPTATLDVASPYTFTSTGYIDVTASAGGYTSSTSRFTVSSKYYNSNTIDLGALEISDFDAGTWTFGTGVPRDYWTNRAAKIPADVDNCKLTNTSDTYGDPDNSAVVDGITISNYHQRAPEFCIGYGMYTPYSPISGSTNYMNFTVNDATAEDYAVYNGWNNYGSGTFNTVQAGNATFGLYRYDTMLRTIKVYSPAPSTVSATVTAAGWATLYTDYALDFSGVAGLTAYTATEADGVVTLTAVDDVPANTGVVLKGTADTYKIPVIASSETDKGGLQGSATVSTNADAAPDGKAYYILTKSGEEAEFQAASGTIAAGKAYLVADWASGGTAKSLRVVVDGETTEVTAPEVAETEEEEVLFNMAGIQVDKNFKGFVINQKGVKRFNK